MPEDVSDSGGSAGIAGNEYGTSQRVSPPTYTDEQIDRAVRGVRDVFEAADDPLNEEAWQ
jgi:hypothetical protein